MLLACACGAAAAPRLTAAVASTVDNSGLAAQLRASYARQCRCPVDFIAAGSAAALRLLARGDVQLAVTHAPQLEKQFVRSHPGAIRTPLMFNGFVLAGPASDPAQVRGLSLPAAFARIASLEQPFVSRGDGSGTHQAELGLWAQLAASPAGGWYRASGSQMAATLRVAAQLGAYTLSDTATLAYALARQNLALQQLAANEPPLANTYSVVLPADRLSAAQSFADWLLSPAGKAVIAGHRLDKLSLFVALP